MNAPNEVDALFDWVRQEIKTHKQLTGFTPNVVLLPADMFDAVMNTWAKWIADVTTDTDGTIRVCGKEIIWVARLNRPRVLFERQPVSRN